MDPTLETSLGMLESGRKDQAAARAAFLRALQLNPGQAEALEAMGQLSYAAGDYTQATLHIPGVAATAACGNGNGNGAASRWRSR